MTTVIPLLDRVKQIKWRERAELTRETQSLIEQHVQLIEPIMQHVIGTTGNTVSEAHGVILTPAYDSQEYTALYDTLSEEMDFTNAVISWPIVMTIVAREVWYLDSELSKFPNPWASLVGLYQLGYPASYLDAPDHSSVSITVFLKDSEVNLPVY